MKLRGVSRLKVYQFDKEHQVILEMVFGGTKPIKVVFK